MRMIGENLVPHDSGFMEERPSKVGFTEVRRGQKEIITYLIRIRVGFGSSCRMHVEVTLPSVAQSPS